MENLLCYNEYLRIPLYFHNYFRSCLSAGAVELGKFAWMRYENEIVRKVPRIPFKMCARIIDVWVCIFFFNAVGCLKNVRRTVDVWPFRVGVELI